MSRPELLWSDNLKVNRALAEQPYYRHHSLRHMCKVLGHGTNYLGSAFEMSRHTKIEQSVIKEFQALYFKTFPAIPKLHEWVKTQLIELGHLVTPFGRKRWFFGKRDESDTLKQAVAFLGQSMTADEMNLAMLQTWRLDGVQLLLQGHDSLLIQYPMELEDAIIPKVRASMRAPLELEGGRMFCVPVEVKVGWNWGNATEDNPDGLMKYPDGRRAPPTRQLDRIVS
jgi:DNA polymerase I-like protein with 3'-5' exonuclease and polymerase domains